jgi:catechol 2,3-dioxygenase-like lactoylglutathione lyase family enzyme
MIKSIAHTSFLVKDLDESLHFYTELLGLHVNKTRPEFAYGGAWLDIADSGQQIHLMLLPNPDSDTIRPEHGGRDKHVALMVENVDALANKLESAGVNVSRSKSGRPAFFCRDPDGNALEFAENFIPKGN